MKAGILDGDTRGQGEHFDQCEIIIGELRPSDLVGEVEVSIDLVSHLDRHP